MKTAKKIASLFFALALFVSALTVSASAKDDKIDGNAGETVKFTVKTGSRYWGSNYVKLKQTKGTAPYRTLATIITEGEDFTKEAKLYGKYSINVYKGSNTDGEKVKSYVWNCTETKKIELGDNSTYTIEVVPYSVEDVFCAYVEKGILHLNATRYLAECLHYDGDWTSAPSWSVKSDKGISAYFYVVA